MLRCVTFLKQMNVFVDNLTLNYTKHIIIHNLKIKSWDRYGKSGLQNSLTVVKRYNTELHA